MKKIVCVTRQYQIGEVTEGEFTSSGDGHRRRLGTARVIRVATLEEWISACCITCGPPPVNWKPPAGHYYYEIEFCEGANLN